jgi:transposase InsO family protein
MTTKYDPYDNATAERVHGVLKTEYEIGEGFMGQKDAKHEIKHVIWLYNTDRPHLSCNYIEPVRAYELENFKLKKWSKKYSSVGYPTEENKAESLTSY